MTQVTCRLTAKNRDQLPNPTLGNRVWATFTFYLILLFTNRATSLVDAVTANTEVLKWVLVGKLPAG